MSAPDGSRSARTATLSGQGGRDGALGLIPADLLRALGLVLVPAAGAVAGWPSAAAMALVFGAQWLLRWLQGGRPLDWVGQAVLLAAGWCSVIGLYHRVGWLDVVVHAATGAVLAALVGVVARSALRHRHRRGSAASDDAGPASARPGARPGAGPADPAGVVVGVLGPVLTTLALASAALALGVVWEMAEWWGHHQVSEEIGVGYDDTLGDLTADAVGALVGAGATARAARRAGPAGESA